VPVTKTVLESAPSSVAHSAMVGRLVVLKWTTGWALGTVSRWNSKNHRMPFEVEYDDGVWPQCLDLADYDGREDARVGSWAFLR
jgi:hypothetical protein